MTPFAAPGMSGPPVISTPSYEPACEYTEIPVAQVEISGYSRLEYSIAPGRVELLSQERSKPVGEYRRFSDSSPLLAVRHCVEPTSRL